MLRSTINALWLLLVAALFLVAAALTAARLWVSSLENYRDEIELAASRALQHEVRFGAMQAGWRGISPVLVLGDVHVSADAGQRLAIREVRLSLDVLHYLAAREVAFSGIDIIGIELSLLRTPAGDWQLEHFSGAAAVDLAALSSISRLSLRDADVTLTDLQDGTAPQRLSGVRLSLGRRAGGHVLTGYASLPDDLGGRLDIEAEFPGSVGQLKDLRGRVYLKAQAFTLPGMLATHLPADSDVRGVGDVRLWAEFSSLRLTALAGEVDVRGFSLGHAGAAPERHFSADRLRGQLGWRGTARGWQLAVQELDIESGGSHWETGRLAIDAAYVEDRVNLNATAALIDLDRLGDLMPAMPGLEQQVRELLSRLRPRGQVRDLQAALELQGRAVRLRSIMARFSDVGCEQAGGMPHLGGLDGSVTGTLEAGSLTLDSRDAAIGDTRMFRGVLPIDSLAGVITWNKSDERLEFATETLRLTNRDLTLTTRLALDLPVAGPAAINLALDLEEARLDRVSYYLPARMMPARGVDWLDHSLKDGVIHNGTVRLAGRLDQLPFDHGEGVLEVRLPVSGARLEYHPGWSAVTGLDAQVDFTGRAMDIRSQSGAIRSARLEHVRARIGDLAQPDLRIEGSVRGTLQVMLQELGSSPLGDSYGGLVDRIGTTGDAGLGLDIRVPLMDKAAPVEVSGTIDLDGNALSVREADIRLDSIGGQLAFDNHGIRGKGLKARLFDKHADVNVWTDADAALTSIQLDGRFGLFERLGADPALLRRALAGDSDWRILLSVHGAPARGKPARIGLAISSSLAGTEVRLPEPFAKPRDSVRRLSLGIDNLDAREQTLRIRYGDTLQGLLLLGGGPQGLQLQQGTLSLGGGSPELPDSRVLLVNGRLEHVNGTDWAPFAGAGGGADALPLKLDLVAGELELSGWRFEDVRIGLQAAGLVSDVTLAGPSLAGTVQLQQSAGRLGRVVMTLDTLKLQPSAGEQQPADGLTPADMPDLQVTVRNLFYGDAGLGRFEMLAQRQPPDALAIRRLVLSSEVLELRLDGDWRLAGGSQVSSIDLEITRGDMAGLMKLLGYQESIKGGKLTGTIRVAWPGPPWAFSPGRSDGKVTLQVKDGQLVDVEPGATGRVLGLLSVSSLPRRLTLDFRDLFADGFSFDTIEGSFQVDSGNAYTNDLTVDGPAARIEISGRVGLVDKDYDQLVTVTPYLRSGLPLAGALAGGPAVGAALIVAGTLLQDKFDHLNRLARKQYTVTGPWSDPRVTRLDSPAPAVERRNVLED